MALNCIHIYVYTHNFHGTHIPRQYIIQALAVILICCLQSPSLSLSLALSLATNLPHGLSVIPKVYPHLDLCILWVYLVRFGAIGSSCVCIPKFLNLFGPVIMKSRSHLDI